MSPPFGRRRRERELDEEIRSHVRMAVDERVARGESREVAERAVRREFGNEARVREVTRMMWGTMWIDRLGQDVVYALRSLRRAPGFASVAVLTIALGVGVTTAMFTVVNGAILRPLGFQEPERLVSLEARAGDRPPAVGLFDRHFVEIRNDPGPFSAVAAYSFFPPVTLSGAGEPVRLRTAYVTADLYDLLGVEPMLGPGFSADDVAAGAGPVAVLGHELWRERLGADREVVGREVTLDRRQVRVVGVMPPGFDFPDEADLWLPLTVAVDPHTEWRYPVVARVGTGVTLGEAEVLLSARLEELEGSEVRATLTPLKDAVVGESRYPLLLLMGAVGLVLIIACANVANLLLMRAGTREREIGVRKAIGAGRARLVRQLLTESLMLAGLGGLVGVLVAALGVEALLALAPPGTIPRGDEVGVDLTALAFVLFVSGLTGIAFGTAPAFKAARGELSDAITSGGRTHAPSAARARGALVVAEVAFAVVLLTGAGLLLRSFQELRAIDLGFDPEGTLSFEVDLPSDAYESAGEMAAFHLGVLEDLRRIPGVAAAGVANFEPLGAFSSRGTYTIEAPAAGVAGRCERCASMSIASAGYFAAMGIPVVTGREFTHEEDRAGARVVVIGRSMAERFWPGLDPVGLRIARGRNPRPADWMTVVGVVGDVIGSAITDDKAPVVYLPFAEIDDPFYVAHARYVLRAAGPLPRGALIPAMRRALAADDPTVAMGAISSVDEIVVASIGDHLFETRTLGSFALLALLLAGVGISGVTAYSVSERRREIGIRRALGAESGGVRRLVLGKTVPLILPGLVLGAVGSVVVGRALEASLYMVSPIDPATLFGVTGLLAVVAVAATLVPARSATRVSPIEVLND